MAILEDLKKYWYSNDLPADTIRLDVIDMTWAALAIDPHFACDHLTSAELKVMNGTKKNPYENIPKEENPYFKSNMITLSNQT